MGRTTMGPASVSASVSASASASASEAGRGRGRTHLPLRTYPLSPIRSRGRGHLLHAARGVGPPNPPAAEGWLLPPLPLPPPPPPPPSPPPPSSSSSSSSSSPESVA